MSRKKKIIVIGNGFDLNLGLSTSYSHFLSSSSFKELLQKGNEMAIYLQKREDLENWVDVELCLKNYADLCSGQHMEISVFKGYYIDLLGKFSEYLKGLDFSKIDKKSKAYNFIISNAIYEGKVADILIYNFNYTPTVKNILIECGWSISDLADKHVHAHGSLDSNMVFGIQDDTSSTRIHTLIKKAARPGFKRCNLPENLERGYDIAIFGYSLGETDEMYFSLPFRYLCGKRQHSSNMELYHHGESGLEEIMHRINNLTGSDLVNFQRSISLIPIDSSR